jgi:hypothetical protein
MKSALLDSITALEDEKRKEQLKIINDYNTRILALKYQCNHLYDDGENALVQAGYPFHSGWDRCLICEKYIETNEYGREEIE